MPPRRAAGASTAKATRSSRGPAATVKDEEESNDELSLGSLRKPAASRTSVAKSTTSSRRGTRTAVTKRVIDEEDSDNSESAENVAEDASEDDEPVAPSRGGRSRSAPRAKAAPKSKASTTSRKNTAKSKRPPTSSDDDDDDEEDDNSDKIPQSGRSRSKPSSNATSAPKPHNGRRKAVVESDKESTSEPEAQDPAVVPNTKPDSPPHAAPDISIAPPSSDEEDLLPQTSLRASAAPPSRLGRGSVAPSSRIGRVSLSGSIAPPPPPAEIETGPKSRLIIHKMALVNFKSYKGRQEIGPFHKVRLGEVFQSRPRHLFQDLCSHSQLSLGQTVPENQTRSTPFCSSLGIEPVRCGKGNCLSSSTTPSALRRPRPNRRRNHSRKTIIVKLARKMLMLVSKVVSTHAASKYTSGKLWTW